VKRHLARYALALGLGLGLSAAPDLALAQRPQNELFLSRQPDKTLSPRTTPELEKLIKEREGEVARRRQEAIKLLETFLLPDSRGRKPGGSERAEALFKLAELSWEDAKNDFLRRLGSYQGDVARARKEGRPPPRQPQIDLAKSQQIYKQILTEHPDFRKRDIVTYLYAFSLQEAGKTDEALTWYRRILSDFPQSRFVPDAWWAEAENAFYRQRDYRTALGFFERVLKYQDSPLYDLALFKSAWCSWRLGDSRRAAERFRAVLDLSERRAGLALKDRRRLEELANQAIDQLVQVLAEDEQRGAKEAYQFLADIGGERYSRPILIRLGRAFAAQARYGPAAETFKLIIAQNPLAPESAQLQREVVENYQALGQSPRAVLAEMRVLAEAYGPKSGWAQANKGRPQIVKRAASEAEDLIRRLGLQTHDIAQKDRDQTKYALAAEIYAYYLTQFADHPNAVELRFYRAEILYHQTKDLRGAAPEYLAVGKTRPVGKFHKDALLGAIAAYETLAKAERAPGRRISDFDRRFAEASDLYADLFPASPELVDVIFRNGQRFYDGGEYDEAVKRFGLIVAKYPENRNANAAGTLILESLNKAKDYPNIEKWASRLKRSRAFSSSDDQRRLDRIITDALFKSGDQLAQQKKFDDAARYYMRAAREYPRHPRVATALFNAGAVLEKAGKPGEARRRYQEVLDKHPNAPEAARAGFIVGQLYEQAAVYDKAAQTYETLAVKHPRSAEAQDALFNAGVLYRNLRDSKKAIRAFQLYATRYRATSEGRDVGFGVGLVYADDGNHGQASRTFRSFAQKYPGSKRTVEAWTRAGLADLNRGRLREADEAFTKATQAWKRKGGQTGQGTDAAEATRYAAQARYQQGEVLYKRMDRVRLAGGVAGLRRSLKEKKELLEKATVIFLDVPKSYGDPQWGTAALYRIGSSLEQFAASMRKSPVPPGLNKEEQQVYREELEKQTIVIDEAAISAYKKSYAKALELKVYNKYTQQMREALARLSDQEYPPLVELRAEIRPSEPGSRPELIEEVAPR
jgi:TolA-binding protein